MPQELLERERVRRQLDGWVTLAHGDPQVAHDCDQVDTTGFLNWGYPQELDGLVHGKSQSKMDDDWGYPHFRRPPIDVYTKSWCRLG